METPTPETPTPEVKKTEPAKAPAAAKPAPAPKKAPQVEDEDELEEDAGRVHVAHQVPHTPTQGRLEQDDDETAVEFDARKLAAEKATEKLKADAVASAHAHVDKVKAEEKKAVAKK